MKLWLNRVVLRTAIFYLQITRGVEPRHHAYDRSKLEPTMYMYIRPIKEDLSKLGEGVKAISLPDERWLNVDIKTLNLIPNILAQTKAEKKFAYSAVLFPRRYLHGRGYF